LKRKSLSLIVLTLAGVLSVTLLTGCSSSDEAGSESYLIQEDEPESEIIEAVTQSESESEIIETTTESESESDPEYEETESESEEAMETVNIIGFVSSVNEDGTLTLALASDGGDGSIEDYSAIDYTLYLETGVTYDYSPADADLIELSANGELLEVSPDEIVVGDLAVISLVPDESGIITATLYIIPSPSDGSDQ